MDKKSELNPMAAELLSWVMAGQIEDKLEFSDVKKISISLNHFEIQQLLDKSKISFIKDHDQ